jgi:hypothetical protein
MLVVRDVASDRANGQFSESFRGFRFARRAGGVPPAVLHAAAIVGRVDKNTA